jgi:hypothetical protein
MWSPSSTPRQLPRRRPRLRDLLRSGDNFKVSMVWNSQAQLDAFGARLGPILAELGIDPGEPEIVEVHSIIKR